MIADRNTRNVQSTMTGTAVRMGIAAGAEAHIMSVLTDLYKDPEAAIVREYSTNGYDAHVEAGVEKAIEVTTPTQLSPFLKVRDFGCGLTVDDIHSIYSQYGASTKRGTNDQVGMLGLGCKSALTYADQFTLTSVKDGTKVVVVVGRDEDGAGTMTVMDTRSTDEPDGTEVMIPAKRHNTIEAKAQHFFAYWPEGSVLLNGKPPVRFEGLRLDDDLYIVEGSQSYVVMGNVAYPADIDLGLNQRVCLVAFVPIGSVNFPPARESLMDTAKTRATLADVAKKYHATVGNVIQREVDKAATPTDAIHTIIKWLRYVPGAKNASDYTYKGTPIPANYSPAPIPVLDAAGNQKMVTDNDGNQVPVDPVNPGVQYMTGSRGRYNNYVSWGTAYHEDTVNVQDWPFTLWLKNFAPAKMNKQHRDKLLKFAAQKGIDVSAATKIVGDPTSGPVSAFIDPQWVFDWTEVRKVQLQPRQIHGRSGKVPGSYACYVNGTFQRDVLGDNIDQSKPVFYVNGNRWWARSYSDVLDECYDAYTLVCLPANRIDKFCRLLPAAKHARVGIEDAAKKWLASLTAADKQALALYDADCGEAQLLRQMEPAKVKDPAIKAGIKVAKMQTDALRTARHRFERILRDSDMLDGIEWTNPLETYPLLSEHSYGNPMASNADHVYLYLNAAYNAR